MSAPMTPDREQEIRTREQAATPGPWQSDGAEIYGTLGGVLMIDLWVGETLDVENQERSNADAAFMADARSAVPELLAEVDRLRLRVDEVERAYVFDTAALKKQVAELKNAAVRKARPVLACEACGDLPEKWCPDCAACRQGCFGGHDGNPCTHPRTGWDKAAPVEDPHDSPLHHSYALGRDLPEVDPGRCLDTHPFSPRDGWRLTCGSCDHAEGAPCHRNGGAL